MAQKTTAELLQSAQASATDAYNILRLIQALQLASPQETSATLLKAAGLARATANRATALAQRLDPTRVAARAAASKPPAAANTLAAAAETDDEIRTLFGSPDPAIDGLNDIDIGGPNDTKLDP